MAYPTSAFITHLVYLHDTEVAVDVERITVREKRTWFSDRTNFGIGHGCEVRGGERGTGEAIRF